MGIKINAQTENNTDYVKSIKQIAALIVRRSLSLYKTYRLIYFFSYDHLKEVSLLKILHGMTRSVIRNRRKELEKLDTIEKGNDDGYGVKKRSPFLDTLILSTINGKPLSDNDIQEEVDTFMFEVYLLCCLYF